jgi:putative membrane protein
MRTELALAGLAIPEQPGASPVRRKERMTTRVTSLFTLIAACALSAACSKGENKADSAAAADSAAKAAAAAAPAPPPAPAPLNDANIVAILDAANAADSAAGNVASTKGTNAEVKTFGRNMMRDHHALRKAGQDLAKKLNVTPAMPVGDTTQTGAQNWQNTLTSTPGGPAWDKAYIDHEVTYHQWVLQTAQAALGAAQDTSLKALITKAAPNIEAHLKHAQSIQTKLSAAPATDAGAKKSDSAAKKP